MEKVELEQLFNQDIPAIVALMATETVVEIVGQTGIGKTLHTIPAAVRGIKDSRILVSVPTRSGVRNAYQNVTELYGQPSAVREPITVGFAAESEREFNSNTQLIYATAGYVLNVMFNSFQNVNGVGEFMGLQEFTHLVVDEAHTGGSDITTILSLWLYAYRTGSQRSLPRLTLISATPSDYGFRNVEIKRYVIQQPSRFTTRVEYRPSELRLVTATTKIVEDVISNSMYGGHILVFVAGRQEALQQARDIMIKMTSGEDLRSEFERGSTTFRVVTAYSSMDRLEYDFLFGSPDPNVQAKPFGGRLIVIATNFLETSITLRDVGVVIDQMKERRPGTSHTGGLTLTLHNISKNSSEQRRGRTGRTRDGVCIRMISEEDYDQLERDRPLDIYFVPIHTIIIKLIYAALSPLEVLIGDPELLAPRISETLNDLRDLIMVIPEESRVTPRGQFSKRFSLGYKPSALLYNLLQSPEFSDDPATAIILTCVLDTDINLLIYMPSGLDQTNKMKHYGDNCAIYLRGGKIELDNLAFEILKPDNELEVALNVWLFFFVNVIWFSTKRGKYIKYLTSRGNDHLPRSLMNDIRTHCDRYSLNNKRVLELVRKVKSSISTYNSLLDSDLGLKGPRVETVEMFDVHRISSMSIPIISSTYRKWVASKGKRSNYYLQGDVYNVSHLFGYRPANVEGYPKEIVTISTIQNYSQDRKVQSRRITFFVPYIRPVGVRQIVEEVRYDEPYFDEDSKPLIPENELSRLISPSLVPELWGSRQRGCLIFQTMMLIPQLVSDAVGLKEPPKLRLKKEKKPEVKVEPRIKVEPALPPISLGQQPVGTDIDLWS